MGRITQESAVTTLASADVFIKDNPSTGSAKIAWSDLQAQIQALFLTNGKLSSSLVPSSFAGGLQYKGTVAGASVPASSGATGDYYLISSAGTSQAITWAVGDFAVWTGAAWQQVAMAGAYTTPTDVAKLVNPRAPRQGLVFDGTAGATVVNVPAIGTGDFTFVVWASVGTQTDGNARLIGGSANSCEFYVPSGTSVAFFDGSSVLTPSPVQSVVAGKWAMYVVSRSGGTLSISVNAGTAGTVASSASLGSPAYIGNSAGGNKFVGTIIPLIYNRALSSSEVLALYESGGPAASDYNSGTGTALTTGTFTNRASSYTTYSGASATGFAATYTGSTSAESTSQIANLSVAPGRKFLISFNLTLNSGTAPYIGLAQFGTQWLTGTSSSTSGQVRASAGGNAIVVTIRAVNSTFVSGAGVDFSNAEPSDYSVSGLTIVPLGLVLATDAVQPGCGLTWCDKSGLGTHPVLPTSGVTWAVPSGQSFHVRGTTSTNGNQQLLGATVLPANCQITRVRARTRTNTPTITIGTASGGSQIVASVALSTTWKDLTIALTGGIVSTASSVWVGSNSTDVVELDMTAEPLSY